MRSRDSVVVWGAGAMGGSIGAALVRAGHEVLFVDADPDHVRAIREKGLRITGPVDAFTVEAECLTPGDLAPADLAPADLAADDVAAADDPAADDLAAADLAAADVAAGLRTVLLCVKAHHTRDAIDAIAPLLASDGCVVSVQNGLNESVIAEAVGAERTVGCFVNFGADVVEPGVILRGNRGAVVVGELDGSRTSRVERLHGLLRDFEPQAVLTDNIFGYLWGKLAYGSMLFATALAEASIADVLASRAHRPALVGLAREAVAVATALGVRPESFDGFAPSAFLPGEPESAGYEVLDRLVAFNRASAKSHSGVWRDLAVRRRRTEVDAQIAPIAEHGREVGVETPLTERLVELIHDVEEGRRAQGWETLDALVGGK